MDKYEFGYNGQMKMNEVAGTGNWNTAEFWEYGTREAQRKNPDPVRHPNLSPYAVFNGNPIVYNDVNGDDWYRGKDGKEHHEEGRLSRRDMKDKDYIKRLGKDVSGKDKSGRSVYGDEKGNVSYGLSEVVVNGSKNSGVFGLGASGEYNIMQAGSMDIGRNDETRQRIDNLEKVMATGLVVGAAAPVGAVIGGDISVGLAMRWLGKRVLENLAGGTADLVYQLAVKDPKDINGASIIGNYTMGPFSSAAFGYTFNFSINSLQGREDIYKSPLTSTGVSNIFISGLANYGAGNLGKYLGVPRLKIGGADMPNIFGPALNIGANVAGNAASDKLNEPEKK